MIGGEPLTASRKSDVLTTKADGSSIINSC